MDRSKKKEQAPKSKSGFGKLLSSLKPKGKGKNPPTQPLFLSNNSPIHEPIPQSTNVKAHQDGHSLKVPSRNTAPSSNLSNHDAIEHGLPREFSHTLPPLRDNTENTIAGRMTPGDGGRDENALLENELSHAPLENKISAIKALANDISKILDDNEIGLDVPKTYFPDSLYPTIFTPEKIKKVLPEASPELIVFICDEAKKLFAITVLSNQTQLFLAMKAFYHHKVTDKDCLPIKQKLTTRGECESLDDETECSDGCHASHGRCKHNPRLDAFHHIFWDRTSFSTFYDKQWSFFLQKFEHEVFKYELHSDCILPFKRIDAEDGKTGPGHFSDVTHALMLAQFQNKIPANGQGTVNVAIKTLRALEDKGYDIVNEWTSESNAHRVLDQLQNDHITRGIAAYSQHGKYHIILEWADGGNLRSFWRAQPKPPLSKKSIMELLRQLHGLADALDSMHNTAVSSSRSDSRSRNSTMSSTSGVQVRDFQNYGNFKSEFAEIVVHEPEGESSMSDEKILLPTIVTDSPVLNIPDHPIRPVSRQSTKFGDNWRHGDIKPDNILRFSNGTWLGTLKLADLGRAKQRYLVTRELPDKEIDRWRTKPYEAPDIWISQGRASMSRLYDCWAMGCVFFEAIVWMLYGLQAIWNFDDSTSKAQKEGTPYWSRLGESDAEVSALVRGWMNQILEHDPECNLKTGTVMGDLLRLVKFKLLQVHLPPRSEEYTEGFRANAEEMLSDLKAILARAEAEERGEIDDTYIFTDSNRANVHPPSIDADSISTQEPRNSSNQLSVPRPRQGNTLALPQQRGGGVLTTRRFNQYTHSLNNEWKYVDDDQFAISILQRNKFPFSNLFSEIPANLCDSCKDIGKNFVHLTFGRSMRDLRKTSVTKSCSLCALLYYVANGSGITNSVTVNFLASPAGIRIDGKDGFALRFCRSWDLPNIQDSAAYPPIGLPRLPTAGSPQHVNILRAWLRDCDERHECIRPKSVQYFPKRLLAVGSEPPRLIETAKLTEKEQAKIKYVALSHPWGDPAHHKHFCTTTDTMQDYLDFIDVAELPQTFKDAVKITRDLKIEYIWIDSICIHQGDDGDFNEQAPHMQDIFGSAYCVFAASSADGMSSGFLKDQEAKAVAIPGEFGRTQDRLFVCQTVDDFQQDVLESHLNKRGWVFQERVLARRTIFFAKNQTYFECANGVRCETFSKLENSEEAFLGDSDFPTYVKESKNKGAQQYLFESLYKKYSRLGFSEPTDKPIAISGLEQRLLQVFGDRGGAGIFEKHWGRCLLWKRASADLSLTRIDFRLAINQDAFNTTTTKPKASYKFIPPPSWSWMSYLGSIDYVEPPHDGVNWNTKEVGLLYTGGPTTSWLVAAKKMCITARARDFDLKDDTNPNETELTYDDASWKTRPQKCIIIGSMKTTTVRYVLIISQNGSSKTGSYERIGVGFLPGRFIVGLNKKGISVIVE